MRTIPLPILSPPGACLETEMAGGFFVTQSCAILLKELRGHDVNVRDYREAHNCAEAARQQMIERSSVVVHWFNGISFSCYFLDGKVDGAYLENITSG